MHPEDRRVALTCIETPTLCTMRWPAIDHESIRIKAFQRVVVDGSPEKRPNSVRSWLLLWVVHLKLRAEFNLMYGPSGKNPIYLIVWLTA